MLSCSPYRYRPFRQLPSALCQPSHDRKLLPCLYRQDRRPLLQLRTGWQPLLRSWTSLSKLHLQRMTGMHDHLKLELNEWHACPCCK